MRRIFLAALLPLLLLAACATPGGSAPPVQITRAEVAESAQLAATALEAAWQGYLASGGKVAPDIKAKVDMALGGIQTLANTLPANPGSVTLAGVANDVLAACGAIMTDLPPGTLPPNIIAAVTAGEIVAHAVLTLIEHQAPASK